MPVAVRVAVSVRPAVSSAVYAALQPAPIDAGRHVRNGWSGLIICCFGLCLIIRRMWRVDHRRLAEGVPQKMPSTVACRRSPQAVRPLGVVVAKQNPQHSNAIEQFGCGRTNRIRAQVGAVKRHYEVRLPGPGLTELVHVLRHGGSQQGAEALVALLCVADRREYVEFVFSVATPGGGQAKVEKFDEQPDIAIGRTFRRLTGSEDRPAISIRWRRSRSTRGCLRLRTFAPARMPSIHAPSSSEETISCNWVSSLRSSAPSALTRGLTRAVISMATRGVATS